MAMEVPDIEKYVTGANGDAPAGGNQQVIAKMLVSNSSAGSVIGKAGASIEQLQRSSAAKIQVSRAGEFFPGTSDRVLLLSGSLHSVLTAIFLILEKISKDQGIQAASARSMGRDVRNDGTENTVKLGLSRKLCGPLIGHKGQTVREFISDSGSTIRVQSLSELTPSDPERIIAVSGARDQVLRAVALILNTLSLDESFPSYMESTLQMANSQGVVLPQRSGANRSPLANVRASLTLYLPDEDVGAVLGKKGQNMLEIQQNARVTVKISEREKMDPDTKEREVTMSGTYAAVKVAEAMVAEKLQQQIRSRENREDGEDGERRVPRRGGRPPPRAGSGDAHEGAAAAEDEAEA